MKISGASSYWTTFNALGFLGILLAGRAIGVEDWVGAVAIGAPSGLVFGLTYMRGFPLALIRKD
jgi:hypothetical protein